MCLYLEALQRLLNDLDNHLITGRVPFGISNESKKILDDLTYQMNKYLLLLETNLHMHPMIVGGSIKTDRSWI